MLMLLFVVRTRQSIFLPPYPSLPLFGAVVATQIAAILICFYGILMPRLSWQAIAAVWVYSLAWMIVLDIAKLLYFRITARHEGQMRRLASPLHV